ncbi:EamA family transporter [Bacillus thuringiensis]|uniref:DMT family transporter n=1 Tax=Bacillus thuringiensis TaxID=1428 RepID=UPI000BEDCAD6|nr:EamA family transporter [Bacillus thuringiensis]PDY57616.1 EamA family transporter [Bacillus thuringiensis]PEV21378.1 EamA family transporter [Bacillus thuringiensis]PEW73462.1 EamA family transporter [Bacillus thuringiensis]PFA31026.1 EamA family transporter [Bacillus thuringiensis]PFD29020.1 EamA family transporter [Bacillus thuringiensis]
METDNLGRIQRSGTKKIKRANSLSILATVTAVFLWSTSFVATKIAYDSFTPLTLGAIRFLIATIILGIIMKFAKQDLKKPSRKDLGYISLSGLLGITIFYSMENIGVKLTTASNAALIVASYPAITVLFDFLLTRKRITWIKGLGIALAVIGVYQITYHSPNQGGSQQLFGSVILILAGVAFTFYTFTTSKSVAKYSLITVSFYQTLAGSLAFIPLSIIERSSWKIPTIESVIIVLYLGIFCSVIAFLLYNYGLRNISSGSAVALLNLVPVFGVLFSILFLNEVIGIYHLIGGLIVILGVFLSALEPNSKQPGGENHE